MPEIDFTIDPKTGKLEMHVKGITGPACEDIAKLAHEVLGRPEHEQNTAEYYLRSQAKPQIRPKHEP